MMKPNDLGDAPSGPGLSAPKGASIPIACPSVTHGWQPIETAPKDGTWILVYEPLEHPHYVAFHVVRWDEPRWQGGDETWVTMPHGPNPDTYDADEATHWMPLPEPPKE